MTPEAAPPARCREGLERAVAEAMNELIDADAGTVGPLPGSRDTPDSASTR